MKRRRQIDGQRFFPSFRRKRLDRRKMPDHRVIHQDIDRPNVAEQVSHHGFDGRALRQVGRNAHGIDPEAGAKAIPRLSRLDQSRAGQY